MPKTSLKIACCLIFDSQGRLLLLRRHAKDLGGGLWSTPGGRQEPGEERLTTVLREVKEETGLTLDGATYLGKHELDMPHGVAHMQTFKAYIKSDEKIIIDREEHQGHRWFNTSELLAAKDIIWGLPTTLLDFGLIKAFDVDPTLADGSKALLIK